MKKSYLRLAIALSLGLCLQSCALDEYFESRVEQYTKAFIKEFGLVDPEQDWTMGHNVNADINVGAVAKSVRIYGKYGDTYYKVADLTEIGGSLSVPVHVPKTCTEMMVRVDGRTYYGTFGTQLNCTGISGRGIPEEYDQDGNPKKPVYERDCGDYHIEVKHTQSGKDGTEYQYFNTQQMGPLVSTEIWSDYYSLNTESMVYNTNDDKGLLPESGVFNANKAYLDNVLANSVSDVAVDFSVDAGENGSFTLFPYYYGTNLIHELGVYLLNDDGTPRMYGGEYIKLPIFIDKHPGDMQVQPRYCSDIDAIKVFDNNGIEIDWEHPLYLNVGDTYQLDVRIYDKSGKEIIYDGDFKKKYHSRIAYHDWVDDKLDAKGNPTHPKRFGKKFVSCDDNWKITAHLDTHGYETEGMTDGKYCMSVSIANDLNNMEVTGKEADVFIIVTEPSTEITYGVEVPAGVNDAAGDTSSQLYVCIDNDNISEFTGLKELWGEKFLGDDSDGYYHCMYQRDASNDLIRHETTGTSNVLLADGKIELLFNDLKKSLDTYKYAIVNQYDNKEPKDSYPYEDYELAGIKFNGGHEWWVQCFLYLQPRNGAPASIKSRADNIPPDDQEMLTDKGGWKDVNRVWSRYLPKGKEVVSFPVDQPMLARTRGYDVKITNRDGTPYRGKFGMYITVAEENKVENKGNDNNKNYQFVTSPLANPYTLYSQRRLNTYGQRTAAAFNHPKSGRTFFTFEDMDLTHKAEDEGGYAYTENERSSDRDVNDLIFLLKGYEEIDGDKTIKPKEEVNEEGFYWIWALEDLGSTGDFDFNDLVMRISDIAVTTTITNAGGVEGATEEKVVRELRFRPLAAGGTLPVHVHLKYNNTDYTLAPGRYDLTKGESPEGIEWHKWFGNVPYTMMVNTGISTHIETSDKNMCVLVVDKNTTVDTLLKAGDGTKNSGVLYVVVQGDGSETWSQMQAIDNDRLTSDDGAYLIPLPEKGKAAQSFFIVDDAAGSKWQWMKEYTHICIGYPKFADWVNDNSIDWTKEKDRSALYSK